MRPSRCLALIRRAAAPGLAAALGLGGPALACPDRDAMVAAVTAADRTGAELLFERVAVDPACDDEFRAWSGAMIAKLHVRDAMRPGADDLTRHAAMTEAARYDRSWWILADLGELDFRLKRYDAAAMNLQLAINGMNTQVGGPEVTGEAVAAVMTMASNAMALAEAPPPPAADRDGAPGGIFVASVRGFAITEVQVPITFAYDSDDFDDRGIVIAAQMAAALKSQRPASIRLAGHTDPRGGEAYNKELSERRALRVKRFLRENGVDAAIDTEGFGEARLPAAPEGIDPKSEDYFRLARRVELIR